MNSLNLFRINQFSPYKVELVDDEYLFETDHNIQYAVSFDLETISDSIIAYWFNLANRSGISSPNLQILQQVIQQLKVLMILFLQRVQLGSVHHTTQLTSYSA